MRRLALALLALTLLAAGVAGAGHELPFYPSYYPQEIRIEAVDPAAAGALLEKNQLHAYVGADPFGSKPAPAHVKPVESLGSFLVLTFKTSDAGAPGWRDREARCAAARALLPTLPTGAVTVHPYPVTPLHADHLAHLDRVEAAKQASAAAASTPRVRAVGPLAERLLAGRSEPDPSAADATLEAVDVRDLVAPRRLSLDGWLGPPWLKAGWYHAYLLQGEAVSDSTARLAIEEVLRRLTIGAYDGVAERLNLERKLVLLLGQGCERVVLGYATRREYYTAEFSEGIENIAADAHEGLNAPIFLRTAKLKDFPWNGWLRLGTPARPAAAWNPVAGFTDPTGRLVWAALGDPASFPAPQGASWIGNRATAASVDAVAEVPNEALLPEPGTGALRPVGASRSARVKLVYRVLVSNFHDGSPMSVADTLYPYSLAYRWGVPSAGSEHDPAVERAAARLVDWLAGVRPVRVDTSEREFGEVKFTTVVQTVEVYGRYALADPLDTATIAPPWSPVPWTVLALAEEAVRRRLAAFSDDAARQLGVPWLDLVRDQKVKDALVPLVDEFARQGHVPAGLTGLVTPAQARERWAALRRFYQAHHHWLVTNGPYRLESWSGPVVLAVFRDFSYPLGVGSYDRYTIPLRAYVTAAHLRGNRLEARVDVETVQKFQREYAIGRQPLAAAGADVSTPECRYVAAVEGRVTRAGPLTYAGGGVFGADLAGALPPGPATVAVACYVSPNEVDPGAAVVVHRAG